MSTEIVEIAGDGIASASDYILKDRKTIQGHLDRCGAVVLTGFPVRNVSDFAAARDAFVANRARYVEGATPRSSFGEDVFSSTDYPAAQEIALHNENSYAQTWPRYLVFGCIQASDTGGATPVADVRAVLRRLPEDLVQEFTERGWQLSRTYGTGFGLSVEKAFGTADREVIEQYCRSADVTAEWLPEGILRTVQQRPVTIRNPVNGERAWFNHIAFWHSSRLDPDTREILVEEYGERGLPFNTFYGDGTPIPDDVVAELVAAYEAEKLARPWRNGDVMIIENMTVAHARESFTGSRQVVVAMGDECLRVESLDEAPAGAGRSLSG